MTALRAVRLGIACLAVGLLAVSCQTSQSSDPKEHPIPPADFTPATYASPIHFDKGTYPTLFAPDSYALWVGDDVAALRRAYSAGKGEAIDPSLDAAAKNINENFLVFEVNVSSAFGDMSIAYDVVGLRGMSVSLVTPDGKKIPPLQVVLSSSAREEQQEALKKFSRTVLMVFPKTDLTKGKPMLAASTAAIRLVIESYGCVFFFEWGSVLGPAKPWIPNKDEYQKAVKTGFNEFYGNIKNLIHTLQ